MKSCKIKKRFPLKKKLMLTPYWFLVSMIFAMSWNEALICRPIHNKSTHWSKMCFYQQNFISFLPRDSICIKMNGRFVILLFLIKTRFEKGFIRVRLCMLLCFVDLLFRLYFDKLFFTWT